MVYVFLWFLSAGPPQDIWIKVPHFFVPGVYRWLLNFYVHALKKRVSWPLDNGAKINLSFGDFGDFSRLPSGDITVCVLQGGGGGDLLQIHEQTGQDCQQQQSAGVSTVV